jgi:hypothetical protein
MVRPLTVPVRGWRDRRFLSETHGKVCQSLDENATMAHVHFRRTVYKAGGQKAADRVSYLTRHPLRERSRGAQQVRYISEGREDCLFTTSKNLPAWAEGKPHCFFQAAERYERANGIAFEEWKITHSIGFSGGQLSSYVEGSSTLDFPLIHDAWLQD